MILEDVFMVRGSEEGVAFFNCNWNIKFLYFLGIFLLIFIDWKTKNRKDYLRILSTGTITWTLAELVLQLGGIRELEDVFLFGFQLPLWIQLPFKGCVEGAGVAIYCIFFSDRMIEGSKKSRSIWTSIFSIWMILVILEAFKFGIQIPDYGGDVQSRRSMIKIVPLLFLGIFSSIGIIWLFKTKQEILRKRAFYMLIAMIIFGTCWTIGEYYAGTRWIEIGTFESSIHAPPLVEFLALTFDVVVEIATAYLPFFVIPILLGHIQQDQKE